METTAQLPYNQWLNALDNLVHTHTGESLYALPELPYAAAYERDLTPDECFDTLVSDVLERTAATR